MAAEQTLVGISNDISDDILEGIKDKVVLITGTHI
jgi:hypothetical protein